MSLAEDANELKPMIRSRSLRSRIEADDDAGEYRPVGRLITDWMDERPFIVLTPIFGSTWAQAFYMAVNICAFGVLVYFLQQEPVSIKHLLAEETLPNKVWIAFFQFPFAVSMAAVKLVAARFLLQSKGVQKLFDASSTGMKSAQEIHSSQQRIQFAQDRESSIEQLRVETSQRIFLNMLFCPIAICVAYCISTFVDLDSNIFYYIAIPWSLSLPSSQVGNVLLKFVVRLAQLRVRHFRVDLEVLLEKNIGTAHIIPQGFFTDVLIEYNELDRELSQVFVQVANLLLVNISTVASFAYISATFAIMKHEHQALWYTMGIATLSGCACVILSTLYPIAKTSDMCHSVHTLTDWRNQSLLLRTLQCGELRMTPEVTAEYVKLITIMNACPLGVKFPVIGLLTIADIMNAIKTIATVAPVAITWALTTLQE